MAKSAVISIIETHQIRNAQQLTAFFTGDESKGIITPYPEGFSASLWLPRLQALKEYYGVTNRKGGKRKKAHQ